MKTARVLRAGAAGRRPRKPQPRKVPKWLQNSSELDAIARSRCLLLLSVLSGELPVSAAVAQAGIAPGTYYKLETRALNAMLAALNPRAGPGPDGAAERSAAASQITLLQGKIQRLEQDKRRVARLLLLSRKTMRAPVTSPRRGRWPQALLESGSTPTCPGASSP